MTSFNIFVAVGFGLIVGLFSGVFGIGGGFLLTPLLIMLGIPSTVAEVTFLHAYTNHNVDFILALLLLLGSTIGAQIGAVFGRRLRAEQLKVLLATIVLTVAVKIIFELTISPSLFLAQAEGH